MEVTRSALTPSQGKQIGDLITRRAKLMTQLVTASRLAETNQRHINARKLYRTLQAAERLTVQVCKAIEEHKAFVQGSSGEKCGQVKLGRLCHDQSIFASMEEEAELIAQLYDLACSQFEPGTYRKSVPGMEEAISFIQAEARLVASRSGDHGNCNNERVPKRNSDEKRKSVIQIPSRLVEELTEAWGLVHPNDSYSTDATYAGTVVSSWRQKTRYCRKKIQNVTGINNGLRLSPQSLVDASSQAFPNPVLISTVACVVTLLAGEEEVPTDLSWECLSAVMKARKGNFLVSAMRRFDPTNLPKYKVLAVAPAISSSSPSKDDLIAPLRQWIKSCLLSKPRYKIWISSSTILFQNGFSEVGVHLKANRLKKSSKLRKLAEFKRNNIQWMFFRVEHGPHVLLVKALARSKENQALLRLSLCKIKELLNSVRISHGIVSRKLDATSCRALMPFLSISCKHSSGGNFEIKVGDVSHGLGTREYPELVTKLCVFKKMMALRLWSISIFLTASADYFAKARDSKAVQMPTLLLVVNRATVTAALRQRKRQIGAMESSQVAEFIVAHLGIRATNKGPNSCSYEELYFKKSQASSSGNSHAVPEGRLVPREVTAQKSSIEQNHEPKRYKSSPKHERPRTLLTNERQSDLQSPSAAPSPSAASAHSKGSDDESSSKYSQFSEEIHSSKEDSDDDLASIGESVVKDSSVASPRTDLSNPSESVVVIEEIRDHPDTELEEVASNYSQDSSIDEIDWDAS